MARVLIIEDNAANRELMAYLLRAFGHSVIETADGGEGLAAIRTGLPDLVVCDLQLPDMDGFAVARQIHADDRLGAVPLIAVTAFAMVGDRDRVLAGGFDGYIAKPIDPERFVAQLETFLSAGAVRRAPPGDE